MDKHPPSKSTVTENVIPFSRFTDYDIHLFKAGKHYKLYDKFGSHTAVLNNGVSGTYFSVWAPNALSVSVIGNFNNWMGEQHVLFSRWDSSGIWEGFIPQVHSGEAYKYKIISSSGEVLEKSDPYSLLCQEAPGTASVVWNTWYEWKDAEWMEKRSGPNSLSRPWSVYELHLGSWQRSPETPELLLNYRDVAKSLVPYIKEMGYTHVEFMPLMEHPYYPSWGYQITGYFAASSRYGSAQDLMYLIEELHRNEIGVILDWVPSHFPGDAHGLYNFDGTHLYEHADPRKGFHPDWKSYIFNYARNEVRSFLISNAMFWLDRYHMDGLRVDAVASMLYLDYSRKEGEWSANEYGGRENLEAVSFLKELNVAVYGRFPDIQMIAEESTSFEKVSKPVFDGGLGFGMKWMMGWMNDTLEYFKLDPLYRKFAHGQITFSTVYAFSENFMLPLSHDEVVYGKKSLLSKMPGDEWQRFANLRLLYTYMFTHPGTKLMFMGSEFGQTSEWNFSKSLDWHLLQYSPHKGIKETVKDLNTLYREEGALYEKNFEWEGFRWVESQDSENSILVYTREGNNTDEALLIILNMTPVARKDYRVGFPLRGDWHIIFNSDEEKYFGSGYDINYVLATEQVESHGRENSALLTVPPLSGLVLKRFNRSAIYW